MPYARARAAAATADRAVAAGAGRAEPVVVARRGEARRRTMSTSANGASDALGMGPFAGYSLISVISVLCVFTVFTSMSSLHAVVFIRNIHLHIYAVINLLMLYFWIKLIMKLPKFLTCCLCDAAEPSQEPQSAEPSLSPSLSSLRPRISPR